MGRMLSDSEVSFNVVNTALISMGAVMSSPQLPGFYEVHEYEFPTLQTALKRFRVVAQLKYRTKYQGCLVQQSIK